MKRLFILLLTIVVLAPASRLRSQQVTQPSDVCNKGQVAIDIAAATKARGPAGAAIDLLLDPFRSSQWRIAGWQTLAPGQCVEMLQPITVFDGRIANIERYRLVFAFTDSTGVWGATKLTFRNGFDQPEVKVCVGAKGTRFQKDVQGDDLTVDCKGYLAPSTFEGSGPPTSFNIAIAPGSKVDTPLGGPASTRTSAPTPSPTASTDDAALRLIAGLGAAVIAGLVIELADEHSCSNSIPKPFEVGTLNATVVHRPVVRRTCQQAEWWYNDSRLRDMFRMKNSSIGSLLDPPQQLDSDVPNPAARRAFDILNRALAPNGIEITNYGKLRYKPAGEGTHDTWANFVSLDLPRASASVMSGFSTLTIPCVDDSECVLHLPPNDAYASPYIRLFMQGQGTWPEVLTQLNILKTTFPKQPIVQAR